MIFGKKKQQVRETLLGDPEELCETNGIRVTQCLDLEGAKLTQMIE